MYDKDGSGTIELAEMVTVIGTLYDMEGSNQRPNVCIVSKSKMPRLRVPVIGHD